MISGRQFLKLPFLITSSKCLFLLIAMTLWVFFLPSLFGEKITISEEVLRQINALMEEKRSWSKVQCKINAQLLLTAKRRSGRLITSGLPQFRLSENMDSGPDVLIDLNASVSEYLLERIEVLGGIVTSCHPQYNAIRARVPLDQLEILAAEGSVFTIRPADRAITNKLNTSQGDVSHRANQARTTFTVDGAGVKIGVLSDGSDSLAARQATGDLPSDVSVLPGQHGSGSEGTAMLEIVHDLAPGADLFFATAFSGQAQFAQNILDLAEAAGCDVIVDDVIYFEESVFQDGIIAQAVERVTASGVIYCSSAGNFGNLNDGTSSVWEGNYLQTSAPSDALGTI